MIFLLAADVTYGAFFLDFTPDARTIFGSGAAIKDADAIFVNAGAAYFMNKKATAGVQMMSEAGVNAFGAAYGQYVEQAKGVVGGGLVYVGYGDVPVYDESGNQIDTLSPNGMQLFGFYGGTQNKIIYGAKVKYLKEKLADDAELSGFAADVGGYYDISGDKSANPMWVGFGLNNIGTYKTSDGDKVKLPTAVVLGFSMKYAVQGQPLIVYPLVDVHYPLNGGDFEAKVGAEGIYQGQYLVKAAYDVSTKAIAVGAGYQMSMGEGKSGIISAVYVLDKNLGNYFSRGFSGQF